MLASRPTAPGASARRGAGKAPAPASAPLAGAARRAARPAALAPAAASAAARAPYNGASAARRAGRLAAVALEAAPPAAGLSGDLKEIATQFDLWNSALATLDPKNVAALYAPTAVLLPTVSNKVRTTPEEIEDYFTNFLKLKPQGTIDEGNVRMLNKDTGIHSGVYTFVLDKDGVDTKVRARFSFTYKKIDGKWLIVDHHSSGMPEGDRTIAEIEGLFDRWNAALATGDPKAVAALYAPTAVLLPTVSNQVRTTPEEIEDYFTNFLKLKPRGTITAASVRMLAEDTAIHSGVYTFELFKEGKDVQVQARFSFTYKKIDGKWLIVDHHSSGMPEGDLVSAEIAGLFDKWNAALQTGDPKAVAALYAPTAVLLPTVSNKVRTSPEEIQDYFSNFLKLKPRGVIDESNVRMLAEDTAIHSGVYTFDLVKEGKPQQVQARFSFTYKKINDGWLIVDHHSSGMPEGDTAATQIAGLFDKWNAALATGNPKAVAALYAPTAVLLPTVSNKVRTTPEQIEDYFTNFLKLKPQGTIDESNVRMLNVNTGIHSGVYTFVLEKDGKPTKVQARFSFTYKKINDEWLIVDHHSSGMPEGSTPQKQSKAATAAVAAAAARLAGYGEEFFTTSREEYLTRRHELVLAHFPTALGLDDFMSRAEVALSAHGFRGDNSIAMTNLARDEVTGLLKEKIDNVFGSSFSTNGIGGVLSCGIRGIRAGLSHSPVSADGRERYVFFCFPHIAINEAGDLGLLARPGRAGQEGVACNALAEVLEELQKEGLEPNCVKPGVHDPLDPEYSILKQRLARRIRYDRLEPSMMDLADMTAVAERVITDDLEYLIEKCVDVEKADYAVVTGVQIHNWSANLGGDNFEFVAPTKVYAIVRGQAIVLDLLQLPPLAPRQMQLLARDNGLGDAPSGISCAAVSTAMQSLTADYLERRIGSQRAPEQDGFALRHLPMRDGPKRLPTSAPVNADGSIAPLEIRESDGTVRRARRPTMDGEEEELTSAMRVPRLTE